MKGFTFYNNLARKILLGGEMIGTLCSSEIGTVALKCHGNFNLFTAISIF